MTRATLQEVVEELKEISAYATQSANRLRFQHDQGLAVHYLNNLSIKTDYILKRITGETDDRRAEQDFLKRQLQLDLAEAAGDAGDSGRAE